MPILVSQQKTNFKIITIRKIAEVLLMKRIEYESNLKSEDAKILFQAWNYKRCQRCHYIDDYFSIYSKMSKKLLNFILSIINANFSETVDVHIR